ncbi:MAG TPA: YdcF family protein [Candidatus Paceibacterota bacterium]
MTLESSGNDKKPKDRESRDSLPDKNRDNFKEKKQEYLKLLGLESVPDCVVVLDAGVADRATRKTHHWVPTSYEDETANWRETLQTSRPSYEPRKSERGNIVIGAAGGKARAIAGAELFRYFHMPLVTTSKNSEEQKGETENNDPWIVYKDYLTERQGVPPEAIVSEKESTSTFEQVLNLVELAKDENWKSMLVILNDHHLLRTKTFFEYLTNKELAITKLRFLLAKLPAEAQIKMGFKISGSPENPSINFYDNAFFEKAARLKMFFGSAESILLKRDPSYAKVFKAVQKLPTFQKRLEAEARGLAQLQSGEYAKPRKT